MLCVVSIVSSSSIMTTTSTSTSLTHRHTLIAENEIHNQQHGKSLFNQNNQHINENNDREEHGDGVTYQHTYPSIHKEKKQQPMGNESSLSSSPPSLLSFFSPF